MKSTISARPFAESLYQLLKQNKSADVQEVVGELQGILEVVATDPTFQVFLETPSVSRVAKRDLIEKVFRGKINDLLLNFLKVLAIHNALGKLSAVYEEIQKIQEQEGEKIRVKITVPFALEDEFQNRVIQSLQEKFQTEVVLEQEVAPEILGGFTLTVGDTVVDGSLRTHLQNIKKSIKERSATYGI